MINADPLMLEMKETYGQLPRSVGDRREQVNGGQTLLLGTLRVGCATQEAGEDKHSAFTL